MNYLYAGCWLNAQGKGGIHLFRQNAQNGALEETAVFCEEIAAGYLCISPDGKYLYAVEERKKWHDFILDSTELGGAVLAYAIEPQTGKLRFLNRIASCGCNPNCLSMDPSGRWLFVVNYGTDFGEDKLSLRSMKTSDGEYRLMQIPDETSVAMISVQPDGSLNRIEDMYVFPNAPSHYSELFQWCAHAHAVRVSPDGNGMIVAERGGDLIYLFKVDQANKKMKLVARCNSPRGVGPRNVLFHPTKPLAYVVGEVRPFIMTYEYDVDAGVLCQKQIISTVEDDMIPAYGITPKDFAGFFKGTLPSDMTFSPCGGYMYVTNRGPNVISILKIEESGMLTRQYVMPSGGNWPRTCVVDPDGRYLYVGNQKSNSIAIFESDGTERFVDTGRTLPIDRVSHLKMIRF